MSDSSLPHLRRSLRKRKRPTSLHGKVIWTPEHPAGIEVDMNGTEIVDSTRCTDGLQHSDSEEPVSQYDLKLQKDHQVYIEDPDYDPEDQESSSDELDDDTVDEGDNVTESSSDEESDSDIYDDDREFDDYLGVEEL